MVRKSLRVLVMASIGIGGLAGWSLAQVFTRPVPVDPIVLSGADVGFRVESRAGETLYGTIVVRINGEWVEANLSGGGVRRLETN